MNGRIYDPLLGRFLSADTVVQVPGSLQSYNRYSYVKNNPLTFFDPTGEAAEVAAVGGASAAGGGAVLANPVTIAVGIFGAGTYGYAKFGPDGQMPTYGTLSNYGLGQYRADQMRKDLQAHAANMKVSAEAQNQSTAPKPAVEGEKPKENTSGGQMDPEKGSKDSKSNVQKNKENGDKWEKEVVEKELPQTQENIQTQITVKPNGSTEGNVRLDAVGTDKATGQIQLTDAKASATAPLTKNQTAGYPALEANGGVVVGQGKPPYTGGTQIPPTKVNIIRKPDGTVQEVPAP